jgi:hypothetical protein
MSEVVAIGRLERVSVVDGVVVDGVVVAGVVNWACWMPLGDVVMSAPFRVVMTVPLVVGVDWYMVEPPRRRPNRPRRGADMYIGSLKLPELLVIVVGPLIASCADTGSAMNATTVTTTPARIHFFML